MDGSLEVTIKRAEEAISKIEERLGWGNVEVLKLKCPYNSSHLVSSKNLKSHSEKCKWRSLGYTKEESQEIAEEITSQTENHFPHRFSQDDQVELLGVKCDEVRTAERYASVLTPQQRLQIHQQIIARNPSQPRPHSSFLYRDLDDKKNKKPEGPSSEIDVIKNLRELKRRRQTYRAKNVHITKRTHTEVLRDILGVHMKELERKLKESRCSSIKEHKKRKSREEHREEDEGSASKKKKKSSHHHRHKKDKKHKSGK